LKRNKRKLSTIHLYHLYRIFCSVYILIYIYIIYIIYILYILYIYMLFHSCHLLSSAKDCEIADRLQVGRPPGCGRVLSSCQPRVWTLCGCSKQLKTGHEPKVSPKMA
jgi:hypothetical protein